MKRGSFNDADEALAAYRAFRTADSDFHERLRALPLRKVEKVPDLREYLAQKARNKRREEDE